MGPIMLDVQGTSLTAEDKELLQHPLVGGLIYFSRNFESKEQISALTHDIRNTVKRDFLIAVDHEGGRVQRFKDGFTCVPAMGKIWHMAEGDLALSQNIARACGTIIAIEIQSVGIDISFAPVLDINGISDVIGDRSFHQEPHYVQEIASAFIQGMNLGGMQATGKHFPGHGSVKADSHIASAIDGRSKNDIFSHDLTPFSQLINNQLLGAIMPAHVIYPQVDDNSVGFSTYWLQNILRKELGFDGVIFSDDLSMEGASSIGGFIERAEAAQQAGCDMLLLCNNRDACIDVIDHANIHIEALSHQRITKLFHPSTVFGDYQKDSRWHTAFQQLNGFI